MENYAELATYSQSEKELVVTAAVPYLFVPIPAGYWESIHVFMRNITAARLYNSVTIAERTTNRTLQFIGREVQIATVYQTVFNKEKFIVNEQTELRVLCSGAQNGDIIEFAVNGTYRRSK